MAKNVRKPLLVSLFLVFVLSCAIPPTYSRKNIEKAIKDICRNEFNIDVEVSLSGETIWVYAPFKELITADGRWNQKALDDRRRIFLSLGRVLLNMDERPKFYCLLASDIEKTGFDTYTIGFIPDLVKFDLGFISLEEYDERVAFFSFPNPKALGDTQGAHMEAYDISPDEFSSYLVKQNLKKWIDSLPLENKSKKNRGYNSIPFSI